MLISRLLVFYFQETTSTTLAWGLAYLINYPLVIEKVRAELDDVIGAGNPRLITIADRPTLPYMNALINVRRFYKYSFPILKQ